MARSKIWRTPRSGLNSDKRSAHSGSPGWTTRPKTDLGPRAMDYIQSYRFEWVSLLRDLSEAPCCISSLQDAVSYPGMFHPRGPK
jgi:hypothetical protein